MFAHTIHKNVWKVCDFAVPLHRQSEQIADDKDNIIKEKKKIKKG